MKQFFKMAFATVVGIFIFMLISGLLFMMCIIGLVSSSSSSIKPDDNSVFVLNLSGTLEERSETDLKNSKPKETDLKNYQFLQIAKKRLLFSMKSFTRL